MNERMMTDEEEAVMNMELFRTEEMFLKRVKAAVLTLIKEDYEVMQALRVIDDIRVTSFRDNLANSIANAIRNTY